MINPSDIAGPSSSKGSSSFFDNADISRHDESEDDFVNSGRSQHQVRPLNTVISGEEGEEEGEDVEMDIKVLQGFAE